MRLQIKSRFILCLTLPLYARTALINVTVDDSGTDPFTGRVILYSSGNWQAEDNCSDCLAHPDPGQVHGGTWHDNSYFNGVSNQPSLAQFTFSGTAVHVLCVLAQTTNVLAGTSDMTFYINGTVKDTFSKPAVGTDDYEYNVTVFSALSLPPGLHELAIQNGHVGGPTSLMLLDAIVYTFDDGTEDSKTSSSTPVGAIIGGIIGGLAFLITTILGLLWWKKRKSQDEVRQHVFQPVVFQSTPSRHLSPRHEKISPSAIPVAAPPGILSAYDVSGGGHMDEPPAYESAGDVGSSNRSGSNRSNDPVPPRRGVKRVVLGLATK